MGNEKNRIGDNLEDIRRLLDIETPQRDDASEIEYAWYVGATGTGSDGKWHDFFEQFVQESRWENGWEDRFIDEVKSMKPGDRIAIKSTSKMKHGLPFNNNGQWVGFADIKAIGIIISNPGDGKNISVQWKKVEPTKRWFTFMGSIRDALALVRASDGYAKKALLDFTFNDTKQDYSLCEDRYISEMPSLLEENSDKEYSLSDLASILKEMYLNGKNNKTQIVALYSFGLKYGNVISKSFKVEDIIKEAGLEDSLSKELRKAINLYASIDEGNYGLMFASKDAIDNGEIPCVTQENYSYSDSIDNGENLVVYGTPGCGKSYYVDHMILGKNVAGEYVGDYKKDNIIRTTFYLDYSNTDFVGQIVPVIEYEDGDRSTVTYRFVPGPFTVALECAFAHPSEKVALVIEELNRGNAPCIFGDLFQLLDRIDEEGKDYPIGTSEYGILNTSLVNYLKDNEHYTKKYRYSFNLDEIRIPANLSIYATMNTSDQNVFTLDTAFKRRWGFEKLSNKFDDPKKGEHPYKNYFVPGLQQVTWESFVDAINNFIVKDNDLLTSEDKQLGVYFVTKKMLIDPSKQGEYPEDELKRIKDKFAYKVFEYLWDDVAKFSREKWFGNIKTLDELIKKYVNEEKVFANDIFQQ